MLKSILNLEGVQGLSKNEQREINGGIITIINPSSTICGGSCGRGYHCCDGECLPHSKTCEPKPDPQDK